MNTVISYFKNTAKKYPDNIAVEDLNGDITYSVLDSLSEKIAGGILAKIPEETKNQPVLVYLPKQIESVASYVAILKTGNPYVPVDYQIPLQRLQTTVDNLKPVMIIADDAGIETLNAGNFKTDALICRYEDLTNAEENLKKTERIITDVVDTDPCYVMYTSGTTGVPRELLFHTEALRTTQTG